MEQYISKSALVAEIESKENRAQYLGDNAINSSMQQFYDGMKQSCVDILSFLDTLEVKEEPVSNNYAALLPCIYNRTLEERVKYCKYCSAACEGRVKELDTWHLQEKEDIYDAVKDWNVHIFVCIMKDGTIQKFTGIRDEDCEGHINVHIDGVNDDYDNVDDIVKWIEYT